MSHFDKPDGIRAGVLSLGGQFGGSHFVSGIVDVLWNLAMSVDSSNFRVVAKLVH